MHLNSYTKYLLLLLVLVGNNAVGQTFSYIYIQGDKETPIYVKMEDEMQPRYGKNYSIISQLAPGPVHVQILFQQNAYPPQNFTIQVPENGYRGFIVTHKGNDFALYDLQQRTYLPANDAVADKLPETSNTVIAATAPAVAAPPVAVVDAAATTTAVVPAPVAMPSRDVASKKAHIDSLIKAQNRKKIKQPEQSNQPQFIDNMVLNNERTVQPNSDNIRVVDNDPPVVITNSDCPIPMDNNTFEAIYVTMTGKKADDRLKYLLQNSKHCFSCNQVQIMAKELNSESQRYSFMKQVYPRVTDQANFRFLENMFTSAEWRSYFRLIMQ